MLDESLLGRAWSSLESYTEAAWARRARGSWPETGYRTSPHHQLVCRPNLDLHTGTTGIYRRHHGNMRRDSAQAVLERALADGPISHRSSSTSQGRCPRWLTWPPSRATPTAIHFDAGSVRYRWLDRHG
ncbi:MAG TPA: hypothetical protein VGQ26_09565 [Streptosporangiaceae bacterium]|nr:hypothetical protein [Streptosporangiaceae bacterium]